MSFAVSPKLTQRGQALLMQSFDGTPLDFPQGEVVLGSAAQVGLNPWGMTAIVSPVVTLPVFSVVRQVITPSNTDGSATNATDGLSFVRVRALITAGTVSSNFVCGELGIMLPNPNFNPEMPTGPDHPENQEKILFNYTNAELDAEVYRMRGSVLMEEIIDIYMQISDEATVNLTPNAGMITCTIFDLMEAIEQHDNDPMSHKAIMQAFANHNNDPNAHKALFDALRAYTDSQSSAALTAAKADTTSKINTHNTSGAAHENRFSALNQSLANVNNTLGQNIAAVAGDLGNHKTDANAHADIRNKIGTDITTHNISLNSHMDIRAAIGGLVVPAFTSARRDPDSTKYIYYTIHYYPPTANEPEHGCISGGGNIRLAGGGNNSINTISLFANGGALNFTELNITATPDGAGRSVFDEATVYAARTLGTSPVFTFWQNDTGTNYYHFTFTGVYHV